MRSKSKGKESPDSSLTTFSKTMNKGLLVMTMQRKRKSMRAVNHKEVERERRAIWPTGGGGGGGKE